MTKPFAGASEIVPLPSRVCLDCGDVMAEGYLHGSFPVYIHLASCVALAERLEREDRERLSTAMVAMRLRDSNLPGGETTLQRFGDEFSVDESNREAVSVCGQFAAAFASGRRPKTGFTLYGDYGSGKTTLIAALGRTLAACQVKVRFENVPTLLNNLKGLLRAETGFEDRMRSLTGAGVLILDDLGRERATRFAIDEVIYPVVQQRYVERRPIVVTTNYTQAQLWDRYRTGAGRDEQPEGGAAVVERLRERSPWIEVGGDSRRKPEWDF